MGNLMQNLPNLRNCGYISFMKKLSAIFLLMLIYPSLARASVNVDISGNEGGSKSEVNIQNSVNTSTNNKDSNTTQTDIVIKTNGEVKEYHGTDGNVKIQSGNGNNSVSIINDSGTKDSSPSASPSASASATPSESPKPEAENEPLNLFDIIKKEISNFLKIFAI